MNRLFLLSVGILVLNLLTGCSIFSFKIQNSRSHKVVEVSRPRTDAASQINTPITNTSLTILYTKDRVQRLFNEIEKSADTLIATSSTNSQREKAQEWKLEASKTVNHILSLTNQEQIFLEAWHYFKQMENYFSKGEGSVLFARNQYIPIGLSQGLQKKLSSFAKDRLPLVRYNHLKSFVENSNATFANSLVYRSVNDTYLASKIEFNNEINSSENFEPLFNYVKNTNEPTHSQTFYDDVENLSNDVVSNTDINIYDGDFFPVSPEITFPDESVNEKDNIASDRATQNIISAIMSFVPNMPENIFNNEAVKPLAVEITGTLEPRDPDETISNQELFDDGEFLFFPDELPTDPAVENEDMRSFMEKMTGRIWSDISNIFPSIIMYLFLGILMIFVIPFLLGYFIGKKRQDPNFTVISSVENRKALP